jgi:nucleotide-binding universal stress UspA family protein
MDPAEDPQQVAGSVQAGTTLRSPTYCEMVSATEHDAADVILQRAEEFDVDLLILGRQHHRGSGRSRA